MKLSVWRFACAVSTVWSFCVFFVGIVNLITGTYGASWLAVVDSIYPGYHFGQWGVWGVIVASLYAALTSWIAGFLLAWIYNLLSAGKKKPA